MTAQSATASRAQARGQRARPRVHFTAREGWINDPTGLVWAGDRYHLYYQAVPEGVVWAPECRWGRAESPDLVHWVEQPLALSPQPFELGCWSGRVVPDGPDGPRLFYTRVREPDWGLGAVAVAAGDAGLANWVTGPDDVVVPGPSPELGITTFRDPFVFRRGDEWVMIVGAGRADGTAAAVHYHSPDLVRWTCDGLLAERPSTADGTWTGSAWECPQLVQLDGEWVLLVSVWDADGLHYVAAGVGEYDGRLFEARQWQRLTHGDSAYAASVFDDRDGRLGVVSWLREEPRTDPTLVGWAGAHSAPALLHRDGPRLSLTLHPDVVAASRRIDDLPPYGIELLDEAALLAYVPRPGRRLSIRVGGRAVAELRADPRTPALSVERAGRGSARLPVVPGDEIRVLLDADILEVFGAGGYGAYRIGPVETDEPLEVTWTVDPPATP